MIEGAYKRTNRRTESCDDALAEKFAGLREQGERLVPPSPSEETSRTDQNV
jgi:hypothetical protein